MMLGDLDGAERSCRAAAALAPGDGAAHASLGNVLQAQHRWDDAAAAYERALDCQPDQVESHNNLATARLYQGRPDDALAACEQALRLQPDHAPALRNLLMMAVFNPALSVDRLRALHERVGRAWHRDAAAVVAGAPADKRPLTVGYLTSDLSGEHPVVANLLPLLARHDRARVRPHVYANVARPDHVTAQARAAADAWCDTHRMSDAELVERLRRDQLDVLVCVAGRLDANRLPVLGHRLAPVQISLFDLATSGVPHVDYLVTDHFMVPPGSPEYFSERLLRLPVFCFGALPGDLPPLRAAADPAAPPRFACFGNPSRITAPVLACWGTILAARPDSRLVLKYLAAYRAPPMRQRLLEALVAAGAAPAQIEFLTALEPRGALLARYNDVDVALDTAPVSGSTTNLHALAMGVPVVTWAWDRKASRSTGSMLNHLGLPELIGGSREDYIRIALRTAEERRLWRARRPDVRAALAASALCDVGVLADRLERFYRAAWRRAGAPA
jgi:predicted O-linked N-acetylglucosamine transferase (SPINDLY family)